MPQKRRVIGHTSALHEWLDLIVARKAVLFPPNFAEGAPSASEGAASIHLEVHLWLRHRTQAESAARRDRQVDRVSHLADTREALGSLGFDGER